MLSDELSASSASTTSIADIPSVKGEFVGTYLVKSKAQARRKDGAPYLRMRISDASGEIEAFVWEDVDRIDAQINKGQVVALRGKTSVYQQRPYVTVLTIKQASEGDYDVNALVRTSQKAPEELLAFIRDTVEEVKNPHYKALLDEVLSDEEFVSRFKDAPGAKAIHHAYRGGLIEHTASILRLTRLVTRVYDDLDADLLITSCVLHDIGKMTEYGQELVIERTTQGRLLGHIVLGLLMVQRYIDRLDDFPQKEKDELLHVLISHHGSLEWGSPQVPMTLEALALHYIDNLDAKLSQCKALMLSRQDPEFEGWTTYDKLLERYLFFGDRFSASAGHESESRREGQDQED